MKWRLQVVFVVTSLACVLPYASADDKFLDQPFKSYIFDSKTYSDGVQELSGIIQKPVTIPDGITDFVNEINGWNLGCRIPTFSRIGRGSVTPTLRDVLDQTSSSLDMSWRYDPSKDRVVLSFSWCREDPRTSAKLLDVIEHSTPLSFANEIISSTATSTTSKANPNQSYFWDHHHLDPNDTWRIAFDALLSKPENFRAVWKLRFAEDMERQILYPQPVINLLSAKIKDQAGSEHSIIINDQPAFMNPGEGTISYYVFDLNGKFEQGGFYGSGHRCHDASAWTDSAHTQVTLRVFFNDAEKMDQNFVLTEKGLVLHDVVDDRMRSILGSDEGLIKEMRMGISPFHITN